MRVPFYYSTDDGEKYHYHSDCPSGKKVKAGNWAPGTGGLERCEICRSMDRD